jgi:hypothetical protein
VYGDVQESAILIPFFFCLQAFASDKIRIVHLRWFNPVWSVTMLQVDCVACLHEWRCKYVWRQHSTSSRAFLTVHFQWFVLLYLCFRFHEIFISKTYFLSWTSKCDPRECKSRLVEYRLSSKILWKKVFFLGQNS